MPPKITLHHLVHSRANRIFWCLEELGLKYDVKVHYRGADGKAPDSLKAVSRLGKIDNKTYRESGSIIHMLLTNFSHAGIETPPQHSSIYWSHFSEGSLMLYLQPYRAAALSHRSLIATAADESEAKGMKRNQDGFLQWAQSNAVNSLEEANLWLEERRTFTGKKDLIGAGDFMMMFPLDVVARGAAKSKDSPFRLEPASLGYVDRMRERPAYERAESRRKEEEDNQHP